MAISSGDRRIGPLLDGEVAPRRGRPPLKDRGLVARADMVGRCVDRIDASLVVLQAPAGYGKTTVLSQWDSADPRPFTWLALDDRDNDPNLLVESIATALDRLEPVDAGVFAPLRSPNPRLSSVVVPRLCDALRDRERPFVMVLDDLHNVENAESLATIAAMAETLPLGSTLAIASREEPPIALGRLRARRRLLVLQAQDLAMSLDEAAQLLDQAGLRLDSADVARLVEHTEGWPVGLYLAALSVQGETDVEVALGRTLGDDRHVADYLYEEFLRGRPEAEVDFLVRTSILDRLSGAVCDALMERQGSAKTLRQLARSNLMVIPLDHRDRDFRYHALLREMLRAELQRAGEQQEAELHARASRWYSEHGDVDHAVEHAIAGGDTDAAGRLIWDATPAYVSGGRHATLRRWLDRFSEGEISASPLLCLSLAASQATLGHGGQGAHWTGKALDELKSLPRADADELEGAAQVIEAVSAARDGVVRMGEDVARLNGVLAEGSPWRSVCCLLEGVSCHLTGDPARARGLLEEGSRRADDVAPNVQLICIAQLVLVALDAGDLDEADALMEHAIGEASRFGLEDQPTLALVFATAALVDAHRGRAEDAIGRVRLARQHLTQLDISPWYEAEGHIVLARGLLLLDDVAGARSHLARAGRYLRGAADATVLREWLERAWQDADAATATTGRWPLTPAELRLLHVLPTHLSFPEIAEQFFVSPNTVKTQARSLYRKLGVASRAEAVECARAAGLLDGDSEGFNREGPVEVQRTEAWKSPRSGDAGPQRPV